MYIDNDTKVLLLPKTYNEFKLIKFPISRDLASFKSFLVSVDGSTVFELNEIRGFETDDNRPTLKGGDFVKSIIIEQESGTNEDGAVLKSSRMTISNPFKPLYLFISIMHSNEDKFTRRFITLEDTTEQFTDLTGDWISNLSTDLVRSTLSQICETLDTDGEVFYKFSLNKSLELVNNRCVKLNEHLTSKGDALSIYNTLKNKLLNSARQLDQTVPHDILKLKVLKHSVDFICDSYLSANFKEKLLSFGKYDFKELTLYMESLKEDEKNLKTVENNMNAIVGFGEKDKKKKPVSKAKVVVKKKVAVGKGALDGFFKRA